MCATTAHGVPSPARARVYDIGFDVLRDILEMLRCDLNNRSKTAMRAQRTIEILEALVGFDTTSRNSNLALVEWVEAYLDRLGVPHIPSVRAAASTCDWR